MPSASAQPPSTSPSPGQGWRLAAVLGLVAAVFAVYANGVHGPFVFDDAAAIPGNPSLRSLWPPGPVLSPPHAAGTTVGGRPVLNLSLAFNWALHGERVEGYHWTNLGIHAAAALALFGLLRRTLGRLRIGAVDAMLMAWVAALLWALHPLQTAAVSYVIQRAESLAGCFYVLTLYAFVRAVEAPRPGGWLVLSWGACLAGMGTKEVVASAPVLVLLYDRICVAGSWTEILRRRRWYYLALGGTWLWLAWLVAGAEGRGGTAGWGTAMESGRYLLTQAYAIVRYLRLAFWPADLVFDYGMWMAPGLGAVAWRGGLLLLLLGATVAALVRRQPAGLLGAWFFGILSVSSSVVPVASQTMAEHRFYLPLAAVTLGVVALAYRAGGRRGVIAAGLLAGVLAGLTVRRNEDYGSPVRLWGSAVAHWPVNARAHNNLGEALAAEGRLAEAREHYEKALALSPAYADAHNNLGRLLTAAGDPAAAWPHFEQALRAEPGRAEILNNAGMALAALGRLEEAAELYRQALRAQPGDTDAHNNLGNVLARRGRAGEAVSHYEEALRLRPGYPEARFNLGLAWLGQGRAAEALPHLQAAAAALPGRAEVLAGLGDCCLALGREAEAAAAYAAVVRLQPGQAMAHYNLGNLLLATQPAEALAHYQAALAAQPALAGAHHNLALALVRLGRPAEAVPHYERTLALVPGSAVAHHNLALALAELGRGREALAHEEAALALDPGLVEARENAARLRRQQGGGR